MKSLHAVFLPRARLQVAAGVLLVAFLLAVVVLLMVLAVEPLQAATVEPVTLHVCADCEFTSLQDALSVAEDGDVIQMAAGSYAGPVVIDKAITLVGDPGDPNVPGAGAEAPVITGVGLSQETTMVIDTDGVTVQGLSFVGAAGGPGSGVGVSATSGVSSITIDNNTFADYNWAAIFAWTNGDSLHESWAISNNQITMGTYVPGTDGTGTDSQNVYGIECTNCNALTLSGNTISGGYVGVALTAQAQAGQTVSVGGTTITGNTISNASLSNIQLVSYDPSDPVNGTGTPALTSVSLSGNNILSNDGSLSDYGNRVLVAYPLGQGTIEQVSIDGSQVTVQNADANSLDLRYVASVAVTGNTITSTTPQAPPLFLSGVSGMTIEQNMISTSGASAQAVYVNGGGSLTMRSNTVTVDSPAGIASPSWRNHAVDLYFLGGKVAVSENTVQLTGQFGGGSTFYHAINVQGGVDGLSIDINHNDILGNNLSAEGVGVRLRQDIPASVVDVKNNFFSGFVAAIQSNDLDAGVDVNANENNYAANTYGVINTTTGAVVDARSCWWGHETGPTHADNPAGQGVNVTDNVLYDPWLLSENELDPIPPGFEPEPAPTPGSDVTLYLPIVLTDQTEEPETGYPDLVVRSISLNPARTTFTAGEAVEISVVVENQGTASASPVWVDLFINPEVPPTTSGVIWYYNCGISPCFGIVWATDTLGPGEQVVLTSTLGSYDPEYTIWYGWFANGTTDIYVYADSWNREGEVNGAVAESNETNNRGHLGGLQVTGTNPELPQSLSLSYLPRPRARP